MTPYFFLMDLFFVFGLFKQGINFLQQINVKNIHPVSCAGIQTYDLLNISLLFPYILVSTFPVWVDDEEH